MKTVAVTGGNGKLGVGVVSALQHQGGVETLNITADDTLSELTTRELLQRFYPDVADIRFNYQERDCQQSLG
jgi:nucleoside-diphosphate-sugar epimerase